MKKESYTNIIKIDPTDIKLAGSLIRTTDFDSDTIYIFDTGIEFLCPCSCGQLVRLALYENSHAQWSYVINKEKISISPSINDHGCESHYFIKENKVQWC